jgi:hypothetical protein
VTVAVYYAKYESNLDRGCRSYLSLRARLS